MQNRENGVAWYAVVSKPHFEKVAALNLEGKGYEQFLPVYRSRHRHARGYREVDLPLFPSYVFCRFDWTRRLPILQTTGVLSIVSNGPGPTPVEDREIENVRRVVESRLAPSAWPFLAAGDRVRIEAGPLAGVEGIVVADKDDYRLVVSIGLLQRSVSVVVDRNWVRPASRLSAGRG
jgi:transcription antitermination factor NusG